ncbi:MAG: Rrf2 family transcriptional regulator [Ardenticatenaceae bacterium]|nr:Rrf2 family transcriptional regulator [Ardenticatenaceae bacterium]MCB8986708.1 Rrf2 family transcriptional regulator [Ardenticatenaceae bacterium]
MSYSLSFSQAIVTVLFVGDKVEQGFYDFVPTKELSAALNIARPTAVKILGSLASAGIIETREGAKGGVRLALPPAEVTILDVFTAIESGKALFRHDFELGVTGEKPTRAQSAILNVLNEAEAAMQNRLAQTTIADLLTILNA